MARTAKGNARRVHDGAILIDGMGVAVLLPTALISQPDYKGKPFLDRAIASGVASALSRSISRDLEISQFWQNLHPRLQPAVPNESTLVPG